MGVGHHWVCSCIGYVVGLGEVVGVPELGCGETVQHLFVVVTE